MLPSTLLDILTGPLALPVLAALVFADAFLVVVPGEIAVTALGALTASTGSPPLWGVVVVAALAAWIGDVCCYALGRSVGLERYRWMRSGALRRAREWAARRLDAGTATVLFTARFVPFARLAVNLVAGAARVPAAKYLPLAAVAAVGWAAYQVVSGAVVAAVVPGGPLPAVLVSIAVAVSLGVLVDLVVHRFRGGRD